MAPKTPLILVLFFLLCYKHWIDGVNCENSKIHLGVDSGETINGDQTALQKHASFFDRNHDGIIYPWETYQGFRAIGAGFSLSSFAAVFINVALSSITRPGKPLSPQFPIEIKNIHRGKHGSDTGVYDTQGRFVAAKFEEMFQKHAHSNPASLTSDELTAMLAANRIPNDNQGWVAAATEWKILYNLCKDKNGLLQKETIRAVYDGSLFEKMEKEQLKKQNN